MTDGRHARWQEHREARREEFLDAALRAIRARGPAVSMEDIAREAGVSKPRFYRYFADRDELFAAVAERSMVTLAHRLAPALAAAAPSREVVRGAVTAYVDLVDQDPLVARFMMSGEFGAVSDRGRKRVAALLAEAAKAYLRTVGGRVEGADTWAQATVAAVGAATSHWLEARPFDKRRLVDHLTAYLWGGMVALLEDEGVQGLT
ncbi:TetR/AcrR family transcriptional regulator [Actinokineospora soli]|uniref:TetR/AcrR family transcriptional regulator n=1 Tax=Actinokineospora soli TaxID=1048753 RepID=A0ABW2TQJ0_9PSEU